MRFFKVILTFTSFSLAAQLFAQKTMYLEMESGVAFSKTEVHNILGSGFQTSVFRTIAPSGMRLGIETFDHTFLEIGAGGQFFVESALNYHPADPDSTRWSSRTEGILAVSYSARILHRFPVSNSLSLSPIIGFRYTRLDQSSDAMGDRHHVSSTYLYQDGMFVWSDSTYAQSTYISNKIHNFECGLEISYAFCERFNVSASLIYSIKPKHYQKETVDYVQTGQDPRRAEVFYANPRSFITIGVLYHWMVFNRQGT